MDKTLTAIISEIFKAPGRSCLFANTRRDAPARRYTLRSAQRHITLRNATYILTQETP